MSDTFMNLMHFTFQAKTGGSTDSISHYGHAKNCKVNPYED